MNEEERRQQEIEDKFFGEKDVLITPDELFSDTRQTVRDESIHVIVSEADAASVIDSMQAEQKLPESLHTPQLIRLLNFLGEQLGLQIIIDGTHTLFPNNKYSLDISTAQLETFLSRGAAASAFLVPLLASQEALGAPIPVNTEIAEEGYRLIHPELLVALLLLLGISVAVAYKIISRYRKKPEDEKNALKKFKSYKDAKKSKDSSDIQSAKAALYTVMMGELPKDMHGAMQTSDIESEKDITDAFKYKKKADEAIVDAIANIEAAMVLPDAKTLENLNKKRDAVIALFGKNILNLEDIYAQFANALSAIEKKQQGKSSSYIKKQIEFEKKKLKYIIDYLRYMKLKWLLSIQNAKNEALKDKTADQLSEEDAIQKEMQEFKLGLNDLLDKEHEIGAEDFAGQMKELEEKITKKESEAQKLGLHTGEKGEEKLVGHDVVQIPENGQFSHPVGINYVINGTNHHVDLPIDFGAQLWVNEKGETHINVNKKGALLVSKQLVVGMKGLMTIEGEMQLQNLIDQAHKEAEANPVEAQTEVGPESEPVLSSLSGAVEKVRGEIQGGSYKYFGKKVPMDDEAIDYHLVRIHREYFGGKPHVAVRFSLSESHWKASLANLDSQKDIPKKTIPFDFENENGGKKIVQQNMRRFNVLTGDKQAVVLVSADEKYRALAGEVRILFEAGQTFSADEIKSVCAEAAKRLGIQKHIVPETPKAKQKLREHIRKIRKEGAVPADLSRPVHEEYDAETTQKESVEALKKMGLHSVYHRFNMDALASIFKCGRVLCTSTRWSKGMLTEGMSSTTDLGNGGATEVFTRILTKNNPVGQLQDASKPAFIFRPEILERMDCYCYSSDKFGSKLPSTFDQRISPMQLVEMMAASYSTSNEVMFHDAIDVNEAEYVVFSDPAHLISELEKAGVTHLGEKPIKEAVITPEQFKSISFS